MLEKIKGYRTMIFAAFVALIPVLDVMYEQLMQHESFLTENGYSWLLVGIGGVMATLRYVTTTPVGKK